MDRIRVIDVPQGSTAVEAQRLMNEPCSESAYMLVQVLPLPDGTTRAFYRMLSKTIIGHRKDVDGKEQAADQIIQQCLAENNKVTADTVVAKLSNAGIVRSVTWVKIRPAWRARESLETASAARESLANILNESPSMGINKLRDVLKKKGFAKGQTWVQYTRAELLSRNTV
jgi:hypothetical protein